VDALGRTGRDHGVPLNIVEAVQDANKAQRKHFVQKIVDHYGSVKGKCFALWGLSFKPRTDDMREAPALTLIRELRAQGAKLKAFDPVAMESAGRIVGDAVEFAPGNYECLEGADALIIVAEWNEFRHPDFEKIKQMLKEPIIFDGRNLYNPERMAERGFIYYSIGRKRVP